MRTRSSITSRIARAALCCAGALACIGCTVERSQPQESKVSSALGAPGAVFMKLSPSVKYTEDMDFDVPSPAVPGNVVAGVTAIAFGAPDSGCLAAHFAGFPAGDVALVRRGTCTFETKVLNAIDAGAVAVIIANSTDGLPGITVGDATGVPSLFITEDLGIALAAEADLRVHMVVRRQDAADGGVE